MRSRALYVTLEWTLHPALTSWKHPLVLVKGNGGPMTVNDYDCKNCTTSGSGNDVVEHRPLRIGFFQSTLVRILPDGRPIIVGGGRWVESPFCWANLILSNINILFELSWSFSNIPCDSPPHLRSRPLSIWISWGKVDVDLDLVTDLVITCSRASDPSIWLRTAIQCFSIISAYVFLAPS